MTTVKKIKLDKIPTLCTCLYIHILMLIGFSISKATMTQNPIKAMLCPTSEAIDSILLRKSSTLLLESYLKVNNIDKLLEKEVKNHTDLSWTVKWDSSKNGTTNKHPSINKKSRISWKLSIGKSLVVDLSNMMKDVPTMMILLKIFKLDWHSWKTNLITLLKQPFRLILSDIHKLHWLFWLI